MRKLTNEEIDKLASEVGVRKIAVINFLSTMGDNEFNAIQNAELDSRLYKWNMATRSAIIKGIKLASE